MQRVLEPEVMDSWEEAVAYDEAVQQTRNTIICTFHQTQQNLCTSLMYHKA